MCTALGHATNNVAEYSGLIAGLHAALAVGVQRLRVLGDSKLVVMQVLLPPESGRLFVGTLTLGLHLCMHLSLAS